jgi:hypothetical protein
MQSKARASRSCRPPLCAVEAAEVATTRATAAAVSVSGARPVGGWVLRDGEATWKPAVDLNRVVVFVFLLGLAFALRR